jgi:hypothetical protein
MSQQNNQAQVKLIFGRRGSGKSTLLEHLTSKIERLITIDPMSQHSDGVIFTDLNELKNYLVKHGERKFRVIYYPLSEQETEQLLKFAILLENCSVAIEEIDLYCSASSILPNFNYVLRRGRHHNINVFCVSQRPFGINRIVTSQAQVIYSFLQSEPRDVDYLRYIFGDGAEKVKTLKKYNFLHFDNGEIMLCELKKKLDNVYEIVTIKSEIVENSEELEDDEFPEKISE